MMFWLQLLLAWCFLSVFLALLIGALIRAGRGGDEEATEAQISSAPEGALNRELADIRFGAAE